MSAESYKELEDFLRSMRQAYNGRDMKSYRSHFWTDKRFAHIDQSGRHDAGWGSYEEALDQEFRYMDSVRLDLKDPQIHVFDDQFATVVTGWKVGQIDPEGRSVEQNGLASFTVVRVRNDWKIVHQHYSADVDAS